MEIRRKVSEEIDATRKEATSAGRYPWNGMWLTPDQIEKAIRLLRRGDRVIFLEVIAVLLAAAALIGITLAILRRLLP